MDLALVGVLIAIMLVLMGLLVYQQAFYSKQIKDLVDRLMARSIGEFEKAKNPPPARVTIPKQEPLEDFDRILG